MLNPFARHFEIEKHALTRCYNRATLNSFARHYETGEPLPEDLYQKLVAARTFRSALQSPHMLGL